MSGRDFQLVYDEKNDDSIIKRDSIKFYHHTGADIKNENSNSQFYFGGNHNFNQIGNGYLECNKKPRKHNNDNFLITAPGYDVIRLVNNTFAYTIHNARISTSSGVEIEQNKFVGPVSTELRLVTQKDGDLSTQFDITDESEAGIDHPSLIQIPINNHTADNRGIIRGHLPLEYIFGFRKSF